MNVRSALGAGALAVGLLLVGCSSEKKGKPVYKVHGRLTQDGKAVAKATVSFYPVDPAARDTPAHGTTDDDGRFEMRTYGENDGAPAGEHIVVVYWPGPRVKKAKDKGADPDAPEGESPAPDRLKGEYNLARSKLRFTVREQDNTADFKLP